MTEQTPPTFRPDSIRMDSMLGTRRKGVSRSHRYQRLVSRKSVLKFVTELASWYELPEETKYPLGYTDDASWFQRSVVM